MTPEELIKFLKQNQSMARCTYCAGEGCAACNPMEEGEECDGKGGRYGRDLEGYEEWVLNVKEFPANTQVKKGQA